MKFSRRTLIAMSSAALFSMHLRSAIFTTLVLLVAACSPGAVENQDANGAGPAGDTAYDGVYFKRGNVVVSNLDRAYRIWIVLYELPGALSQ